MVAKASNPSSGPAAGKLVAWLFRLRLFGAGVAAIVFAIAAPWSARLRLDRSVDSLFAADDPTLVDYQELQATFGGNAIVLLVYDSPELMTPEGIIQNAAYSDRIQLIQGVQSVLSPAKLSSALAIIRPELATDDGADPNRLLTILNRQDSIVRQFERLFAGYTHSDNLQSGAVVALLSPDHTVQTILDLKAFANELSEVHKSAALVGEPVLLHDGFELIQRDGRRLSTITMLLLGIALVVSLGELKSVLLAGLCIAWTNTVTRGVMASAGIQLTLVSTILVAVVTVIVVAAVLHLGIRQRMMIRRGASAGLAARSVAALLTVPICWTCLTDAAGFAALSASRIVPVQQFGMMIALASVLALIAIALLGPTIYAVSLARGVRTKRSSTSAIERRLHRIVRSLVLVSVRHRISVVLIGLALGVLGSFGLTRMETETSFLNNFRRGSPTVAAYDLVESNFGGAGVWDVVLDAPQTLSTDYMDHVRSMQRELREIDISGTRLSKVISLADAEAIAAKMPLLSLGTASIRLSGMRVAMPVFSDALTAQAVTGDDQDTASSEVAGMKKFRVMLRSQEQLPAARKLELISAVESVVTRYTTGQRWTELLAVDPADRQTLRPGRVTGYYVLMARLVSQLTDDQWRCMLASIVGVSMLLWMATRSAGLAAAAVMVNMIPVAIVLTAAGLLGGKLNMGAAMIGAVSIGLSIDGSIHFLMSYQRIRRRGHAADLAVIHAASNVGLPIVLATLALVIGFATVSASEFLPTATFGTLVAATLFVSMVTNLSLLPAIVSFGQSKRTGLSRLPIKP